jgi:hypothetical protein
LEDNKRRASSIDFSLGLAITMRPRDFVRAYAEFLEQGSAGLFIGAGLSMQAGYPSWLDLVRDMAEEIGLDATREPDLPSVVQYFLNKSGKTRTRLGRTIVEHFGEEKSIPEIFRVLARLPLRHIWTTNYDTLPERAWREQKKRLDVKSIDKDVIHENPLAHAVLYKMHGTVEHPGDVVIAKGDYESYRRKRGGFLHLLTGHLISRHMLFLGFSFTDPNLTHLFTLIRESFDDAPPEHFAIVRKPARSSFEREELFEFAVRRYEYWKDDLQNYGIQCIEVNEYGEIEELLLAVERRLVMNSVMVSGSFPDTRNAADVDQRSSVETIAYGI